MNRPAGTPTSSPLGAFPFALAALSALAAAVLFPLILSKPGRILGTPDGLIVLNPVSLRGLALWMGADIACVLGLHLGRSLLRPNSSLLPVNAALGCIAVLGLIVGGLGTWLLEEPWEPLPEKPLHVPRGNAVDLAGFACAALALSARLIHGRTYSAFWIATAPGRPAPERPQTLPTRLYNGFFMGLILGTILGMLATVAAAFIIHVAGLPAGSRPRALVLTWSAVSLAIQVWAVNAGLRGRITQSRRMPSGR